MRDIAVIDEPFVREAAAVARAQVAAHPVVVEVVVVGSRAERYAARRRGRAGEELVAVRGIGSHRVVVDFDVDIVLEG